MKRKLEVFRPLWTKLTSYQLVALLAATSLTIPLKSEGLLKPAVVSESTAKDVTGKVTDTKGEAIPGVAVVVKGSQNGTITDVDGNYVIQVPNDQSILTFSSVGFEASEVTVGTQTVINVKLEVSNAALEEVVVTALGIQREKKALTYATQQIGGQELRRAANTNFVDALNGKAAGIDIKVSSSGAGGSTRAVLRGNKSLQGSSEALYVIDVFRWSTTKGCNPALTAEQMAATVFRQLTRLTLKASAF